MTMPQSADLTPEEETVDQPAFLDTFTGRLRLEGVLSTRTGLHIGAGGSGDPLATDSPVVRNAAGHPYVPGSSLKGVVRSAAESLLRGAEPGTDAKVRLWTCEFLASEPCIGHTEVEGLRKAHKERLETEGFEKEELDKRLNRAVTEEVWRKSCTICRLFGSLALASRVRFPDLPLRGGLPLLELRNGVGIDRDKELAASGVLYDFEAVPPGTPFDLTVILDNAREPEVGLVLYLFDQLGQGNLALGGKTSRGLGQVEIRWTAMHETRLNGTNPFAELLSSHDLLAGEGAEEPVPTGPPEPKLPTSGDAEAWKTLAEILSGMPQIDKGVLGQQASEAKLRKDELNERLAMGLEGRKAKKVWDEVLARFVECGFLAEKGGGWILASEAPEEAPAAEAPEERDPQLQQVYDRYVGAMGRLWQEAF